MDFDTSSYAAAGSDDKTWLQINLAEVHCIQQVGRYVRYPRSVANIWTCEEDRCNDCGDEYCKHFTVTISIDRSITSYHPSVPDCSYGDTVKLESMWHQLYVTEIWIIGKQGYLTFNSIRNIILSEHSYHLNSGRELLTYHICFRY